MNRKNLTKGFTLIELLVVVAIIGILASVVLASLNSARAKGADAAIKSNMSGMRAQAELFYDSNSNAYASGTGVGSSVGACPTTFTSADAGTTNAQLMGNSNFYNAMTQARTQSGGSSGMCGFINTASMWSVIVPLKSDASTAWCIDSLGNAKQTANGGTAYTTTTLYADTSSSGCGS